MIDPMTGLSIEHDNPKITQLRGADASSKQPRFELIPFAQIAFTASRDYLVKGIVPRNGLVLIYGAPKCGKSFFVFDLLMHVALGREYRSRRVQRGPVVYVAAEGGDGFKKRARAFCLQPGDEPQFYLVTARPDLIRDQKRLIADIRAQLGGNRPVTVCLDTVNRTLVGSESKDVDVARYLAAAAAIEDAFTCSVVLIHHSGLEKGRPRGHTSLTGAADVQIAVNRDAANNVVATIELSKDGAAGDEIVSRLQVVEIGKDPDDDPVTSCVVMPVDGGPIHRSSGLKLKLHEELARRSLAELLCERGETPPYDVLAGCKVVRRDAWRDQAYRDGFKADATPATRRKAWGRTVERLQLFGLIGQRDNWVWMPGAQQ